MSEEDFQATLALSAISLNNQEDMEATTSTSSSPPSTTTTSTTTTPHLTLAVQELLVTEKIESSEEALQAESTQSPLETIAPLAQFDETEAENSLQQVKPQGQDNSKGKYIPTKAQGNTGSLYYISVRHADCHWLGYP